MGCLKELYLINLICLCLFLCLPHNFSSHHAAVQHFFLPLMSQGGKPPVFKKTQSLQSVLVLLTRSCAEQSSTWQTERLAQFGSVVRSKEGRYQAHSTNTGICSGVSVFLSLHACISLAEASGGYSLVETHGLLTAVPFCVVEHGLQRASVSAVSVPSSIQFSSVAQTFCDPMDCSRPGFLVHHQLPQLAQTHVH